MARSPQAPPQQGGHSPLHFLSFMTKPILCNDPASQIVTGMTVPRHTVKSTCAGARGRQEIPWPRCISYPAGLQNLCMDRFHHDIPRKHNPSQKSPQQSLTTPNHYYSVSRSSTGRRVVLSLHGADRMKGWRKDRMDLPRISHIQIS